MGSRCFYAVYGATFCYPTHELEDTQFVKRKLIAGTKEVYILLNGIGRSSIWYGLGQQSDSDPVGNTKRDEPELSPPLYSEGSN